jgi:hypothetical protein
VQAYFLELSVKINTIYVPVVHVLMEIVLIYTTFTNASVMQVGLDQHVAFKSTTVTKIFVKMVQHVHQYLVEWYVLVFPDGLEQNATF